MSTVLNKREKKPKGQSRMDNAETLATFGSQNTGRIKQKKAKTKLSTIQIIKKMDNPDPI